MNRRLETSSQFCRRFGCPTPILLAPMAGSCPPALSIAVANAGGMGAAGVLLMSPAEILAWVRELRAGARGPSQLNNGFRAPPPPRAPPHEARGRPFRAGWAPGVRAEDA